MDERYSRISSTEYFKNLQDILASFNQKINIKIRINFNKMNKTSSTCVRCQNPSWHNAYKYCHLFTMSTSLNSIFYPVVT